MSTITDTNCSYHPERPAMGNCSECGKAICLGCQMQVAGKTVCQPCVSAIRQRVAGEMAAGDAATQTQSAPPPLPYAYAPPTADGGVHQTYAPPMEAMGFKHVFGGFGLGFLAGIVGLAAWIAFVYFTNFNISFFAIGIGWLVGIASVKGSGGRGGNVVAMISAILAFIFCGAGVLLFGIAGGAGSWIFGAVCLFFGVRMAYTTPMAASEHW